MKCYYGWYYNVTKRFLKGAMHTSEGCLCLIYDDCLKSLPVVSLFNDCRVSRTVFLWRPYLIYRFCIAAEKSFCVSPVISHHIDQITWIQHFPFTYTRFIWSGLVKVVSLYQSFQFEHRDSVDTAQSSFEVQNEMLVERPLGFYVSSQTVAGEL